MNNSKKTVQDLINVLVANNISIIEYAYDDYDATIIADAGFGEFIEVEQRGGEDQGSEWYKVNHYPEQDLFVRLDGWYSSYDGINFHDDYGCLSEVRPHTKTITVYE